jgi:hypothetical protein
MSSAVATETTYRATWTHNGTFRTSGTFVARSADEVRETIAAQRGTAIEVTEVAPAAPKFVPVLVNTGTQVHAADPAALAEGNAYAVECGAIRVRGHRVARYRKVDAEVTCTKCRKAHGLA